MVTVPIHQASSFVPPLSTPVIDLSPPKPVSSPAQTLIFTATTTTTTTTLPLPPPPQQQSSSDPDLASRVSALEQVVFTLELHDLPHQINQTVNEVVKEAVQTALQAPLHERFRDLSEAEMKEIRHQRMFESGTYQSQLEHVALYEALEASMDCDNRDEFLEATAKSCKRRRDDQDLPPPPSDSKQGKKKRHDSDASAPHQPQAQTSSAWMTTDIRDAPLSSSKQKTTSQSEQPIEDVPIPDDVHISYSEDIGADPLLKIKTRPDWLKPIGKSKLYKADLEGPAYKVVRAFHSNNISFQFQMEECHLLLTDQIELVNPEGHRVVPNVSKGSKERRSALSISKLKAANYPDFGLEELVPSLWIECKREYDTYERYGYTFLKEIVLRKVDYNEHKISEANLKNLHPNDFEDMYLLHLQGKLNHLSGADKVHLFNAVNLWIRNVIIRKRVEDLQLRIESYQTKLNLTQPNWDASDFLFKEYYTIVSKPRAVIYKDRNDQKKMMRVTKVHKFSDGTLTRILEKLDHMVKDFKLFKYNPCMEKRIWSEDDRMRSKEFMEVIKRRLNIRRIFRSLESFISGRLRDIDYRLLQRTE
ncbi:hypothetical protein Tco_0665955 [Tanacetum coccineum]